MKAVVWKGNETLVFDPHHPDPVCREDWVVIRVMSAGICATDLQIIKGEFGDPPLIPGHEICGVITEMGPKTQGCAVGDRVVVETAVSCGHCEYCRSGQKHLCAQCHEIGFPPHNGGYAQFVTVPAGCVHRIPDSMSFDEGGILEAVLCPFGMLYRWGIIPEETVLIQGTGVAGLSFLQSAKALGAGKVIMAARNPYRLAQAKRFGADVVINTNEEDLKTRVLEETGGLGAGLSIDAAGAPRTIEMAVRLTKPGGRCMFYGLSDGEMNVPLPVREIILRQLTLMGGFNNELAWDPLIALIAEGRITIRDFVTGHCTLETVPDAIEELRARPDHLIKTVIHPWE